ncbi:hypothetical protein Anapl_06815 [Anas platyrhynchos]|uniref:Uncharacterized protein n=1 Tax=Anas platyrhynchos TaxID=8839 RepID=R0KCE9_ANAPL|nr:hypothetical protein Anapl_06815 [Anas platyrhynchos]
MRRGLGGHMSPRHETLWCQGCFRTLTYYEIDNGIFAKCHRRDLFMVEKIQQLSRTAPVPVRSALNIEKIGPQISSEGSYSMMTTVRLTSYVTNIFVETHKTFAFTAKHLA